MKLKSTIKAAVAAVALAFAGTAMADINTGNVLSGPQGGNGELFLSVWNPTSQLSYTRDLGINMNTFLPTGSASVDDVTAGNGVDYAFGVAPTSFTSSVLTPGYKLVFGNDGTGAATTLSTLLGQTGTIWNVTANDNIGTRRLLFTTNNAAPSFNDTQLSNATAKINTFLSNVNLQPGQTGAADPTANGSSISTSTSDIFNAGNSGFSNNYGGISGLDSTATVGTDLNFWIAATGATPSIYTGGTWSLDNTGSLSYQVAAVPEPGTWAMLMAGLMMVGGIARRRMSV